MKAHLHDTLVLFSNILRVVGRYWGRLLCGKLGLFLHSKFGWSTFRSCSNFFCSPCQVMSIISWEHWTLTQSLLWQLMMSQVESYISRKHSTLHPSFSRSFQKPFSDHGQDLHIQLVYIVKTRGIYENYSVVGIGAVHLDCSNIWCVRL